MLQPVNSDIRVAINKTQNFIHDKLEKMQRMLWNVPGFLKDMLQKVY